jgi:hypothetical protein
MLRRRRSLRRWAKICASFAVALVLMGTCAAAMWGGDSVEPGEFSSARDSISRAGSSLAGLRTALSQTHRTLATINEIAEQPDWSLLMDAVGRAQSDDIFLTDCEVAPANVAEARMPADSHRGAIAGQSLRLVGVGRSQETISHFVIRLQGLPIFGHVKLVQTSRQQFNGMPAVGFEVFCLLRGEMDAGQ